MLRDKNVVITGGSSGIGLAIAQHLAREGARIAIGSRRREAIEAALATLAPNGFAIGEPVDVADSDQVTAFFAKIVATMGHPDILILAAGVNIRDRSMQLTTKETWEQLMGINASGAFYCMQAALPKMRENRNGLIVNISSVAGKRATALGGVAYCASKFAMTALGTAVANEVNADGVRVTNVYPGEVNTPILDHRPIPVTDQQRSVMLQPDDVAQLIVSLCKLPNHVHVPEVVIKPLHQVWH